MNHECHWTDHREHLPARARPRILRVTAADRRIEKHFTLRMADGSRWTSSRARSSRCRCSATARSRSGLPARRRAQNTFDLVVRTVGRVSDGDQPAGARAVALRARAARPRLRPRRAARPRRPDRRRRHRPLPDAQPDPVHPRPPRASSGASSSSTARAIRSSCCSSTTCAAWRISKDVEYHETVDRADRDLEGQRRRHHHAVQAHEDRPGHPGRHLRPAGHVPVRHRASSTSSASRATTSSSTSSAA